MQESSQRRSQLAIETEVASIPRPHRRSGRHGRRVAAIVHGGGFSLFFFLSRAQQSCAPTVTVAELKPSAKHLMGQPSSLRQAGELPRSPSPGLPGLARAAGSADPRQRPAAAAAAARWPSWPSAVLGGILGEFAVAR